MPSVNCRRPSLSARARTCVWSHWDQQPAAFVCSTMPRRHVCLFRSRKRVCAIASDGSMMPVLGRRDILGWVVGLISRLRPPLSAKSHCPVSRGWRLEGWCFSLQTSTSAASTSESRFSAVAWAAPLGQANADTVRPCTSVARYYMVHASVSQQSCANHDRHTMHGNAVFASR